MKKPLRIGLLEEGKIPPDHRAPLTPSQCRYIVENFPVEISAEPSSRRCYSDEEYKAAGIPLCHDLSGFDLLLGVKEVPIERLIDSCTYMFFSHTIKEQAHNRALLQAILKKGIRLIDYEALVDQNGTRIVAFGHFAGMVGAHNAIYSYGKRMDVLHLKRLKDYTNYEAARRDYEKLRLPVIKVVLTGTGRVGTGAALVLRDMGFYRVSPEDYLSKSYNIPVFTQVSSEDYARHIDGKPFDKHDFYTNPSAYRSHFEPYWRTSDVMINGIFWQKHMPHFFTIEDMRKPSFRIQVIGDISCDIAPNSSIPSTIRATSIEEPVFGFDPMTCRETAPYQRHAVDVMAIDNLPNELARDASESFGNQFIRHLLPELLKPDKSIMLEKATVAVEGSLGRHFLYLQDYVE